MKQKINFISIFGLLVIFAGAAAVSCAQTRKVAVFNPPKHIKLTVKDFSRTLDLQDGELGGWRLVNAENRTLVVATEGDTISWSAGNDQALQFQFSERLSSQLFRVIEGDKAIFKDTFSFNLQKGETLTVEVKKLPTKGLQNFVELSYAVLNRTAGELVATDSPPKILLVLR